MVRLSAIVSTMRMFYGRIKKNLLQRFHTTAYILSEKLITDYSTLSIRSYTNLEGGVETVCCTVRGEARMMPRPMKLWIPSHESSLRSK